MHYWGQWALPLDPALDGVSKVRGWVLVTDVSRVFSNHFRGQQSLPFCIHPVMFAGLAGLMKAGNWCVRTGDGSGRGVALIFPFPSEGF